MWKDLRPLFLGQSTVCDHRVILLRCGDAFPVLAADAWAEGADATPGRAIVNMTTLTG
jgi:hypothetical protein